MGGRSSGTGQAGTLAAVLLTAAAFVAPGTGLARAVGPGTILVADADGNLSHHRDEPAPALRRVPPPRAAPAPRPALASRPARAPRIRRVERAGPPPFDGAWAVSSGGRCASSGSSQVTIAGGRVIGQGVSGRVGPDGAVTTLGTFNGLTVVGRGQINGATASGAYRQSDGCVGTWSAIRL